MTGQQGAFAPGAVRFPGAELEVTLSSDLLGPQGMEPGTLALSAAGLVALGAAARRRQRASDRPARAR